MRCDDGTSEHLDIMWSILADDDVDDDGEEEKSPRQSNLRLLAGDGNARG